MLFEKRCKNIVLYSRRLLQFIESFSKSTNFFVLLKFIQQLNVYLFVNILIKKSNNNIYLLQILIVNDNKNKDNFVVYQLNYNCEDFDIIYVFALLIIFNDLTSFVTKNFAIYVLFDFIDLFTTKNVTLVKYCANNINIVFFQKFYFV